MKPEGGAMSHVCLELSVKFNPSRYTVTALPDAPATRGPSWQCRMFLRLVGQSRF